ncbi:hypothetical protein IFM89_034513 [Coptis chinensis]|uniref:Endonuclease/exonuclease/phosphatase domain-containing protein n=1 Tax=Coptis chinensis TaxID=261450 RepID=A0A835HPA2_9MAGN|nr:hypothetical protein IFM89_034513 [Coptis chinensis]
MKTISWNCRGCGSPSTIRHLKHLITLENPDILFLSETKASSQSIAFLIQQLNYPHHFSVPPIHTAGGLCLLWKFGINLSILSNSTNSITTEIKNDPHQSWIACFFYGSPYKTFRNTSWDPIRNLDLFSLPILIIGDLNVTISNEESLGGKPYEYQDGEPAHTIINDLALIDIGFQGYPYTWSNKRTSPDNIQKRLDRALVNTDWFTLFPDATLVHKAAIGSDHCPILLDT